jgi:hypothetical protein
MILRHVFSPMFGSLTHNYLRCLRLEWPYPPCKPGSGTSSLTRCRYEEVGKNSPHARVFFDPVRDTTRAGRNGSQVCEHPLSFIRACLVF